jgi:anti-sigma factor RsiW
MLIPNHPHDERLSALASGDPEALADSVLSEHVSSCHRCTDTVAELGALRASLAELPDLRPHRPLQLLPPVPDMEPSRVDRVGGWARRFFAPVLTAGAALALVGLVGTTVPLAGPTAQSDSGAAPLDAAVEAQPAATAADGRDLTDYSAGAASGSPAAGPESAAGDGDGAEAPLVTQSLESQDQRLSLDDDTGADEQQAAPTEERSIWPMLLFAGVAIMIAAGLLRWIFAPRAG